MTRSSDLVMVEREVLESIRAKFTADAVYSPYYPGARMSRTKNPSADHDAGNLTGGGV